MSLTKADLEAIRKVVAEALEEWWPMEESVDLLTDNAWLKQVPVCWCSEKRWHCWSCREEHCEFRRERYQESVVRWREDEQKDLMGPGC